MTISQAILLAVVGVPLALVATNRLRIDLAALLMAVVLGILQMLGMGMLGPANTPAAVAHVISGFSQPIILILISLFIMTRLLEKSGLTGLLARWLIRLGGANQSRLICLLSATSAVLSLS